MVTTAMATRHRKIRLPTQRVIARLVAITLHLIFGVRREPARAEPHLPARFKTPGSRIGKLVIPSRGIPLKLPLRQRGGMARLGMTNSDCERLFSDCLNDDHDS